MKGTGVSMCGLYTHTQYMNTGGCQQVPKEDWSETHFRHTPTYTHTHTICLTGKIHRYLLPKLNQQMNSKHIWQHGTFPPLPPQFLTLHINSASFNSLTVFSASLFFFQVVELNKTICLCLRKISPYLIPFNEVASVPQRVRDGRRLEFQRVDPRLSTRHGFTHTLTLTFSLSHTCTD